MADENTDTPADDKPADDAAADNIVNDAESKPGGEQNKEGEAGDDKPNGDAPGDEPGTDDKAGEGGDDDKGADTVPETYEAFTYPEGVEATDELHSSFSEVAKALGLTQAKAQQLVELSTSKAASQAQAQSEAAEAQVKEWGEQSAADKEFGGAKFAESKTYVAAARDQFCTPEFRDLMDNTGLGNHPEMVRFMVRVGKALAEDSFTTGEDAKAPLTPGQRMYGAG